MIWRLIETFGAISALVIVGLAAGIGAQWLICRIGNVGED